MLVQVHDEVVIRVDEQYVDEVMPWLSRRCRGSPTLTGEPILGPIPLIVSAKVGYTWASAKGAK